jgi:hypothetical protein
LGIGGVLNGLLGGGDATEAPTASASPSPSGTAQETKPSSAAGATVNDTTATVKKTADKASKAAANAVADAVKSAKSVNDATASPTAPAASPASTPSSSAKTPYPCPTYDAGALAAARQEEDIPLLPDDPWTLRSSLLTLTGLNYAGIVEVKTYSGRTKKVLKFTASGVDIKDLRQTVVGPDGTTGHVDARSGSTSTIRDGMVTMYTESLKGNLFGLVPITFAPDSPPPVNLPVAYFTDVTVVQAGQFGGTLTIPGMHLYNTAG